MTSAFSAKLKVANPQHDPAKRRWLYVPYDQLSTEIGPLGREAPGDVGVVMVESAAKGDRRPYHKQKLALILANQRHFALDLAERGVAVRYLQGDADYGEQLAPVAREVGGLEMMEAAERELRQSLRPLIDEGCLAVLPHEGWISTDEDFEQAGDPEGPWRMDAFYRAVRQRTGILMEDGKPVGGKYSFDADNREKYKGEPPVPKLPSFEPDEITREVGELIESRFDEHPGRLCLEALPATQADAQRVWDWFLDEALPCFGPFQDAMSQDSSSLFHARISALLHLHRLLPWRVVRDVLERDDDVSIASREGFVRQIIGWREYVRHVHRVTDGLRDVPTRNHFGHEGPLPPAFWGKPSGLNCLDRVVDQVWAEGYGHHITRLMVLSNLATLLEVEPDEISDWFWVAYTDAFDWVVQPNVIGMGVHALGDLMTTKPYVCGGAYINRMGDYCRDCAFNPRKDCPITSLYWSFLARHRDGLEDLGRMQRALWSLDKRGDDKREHDAAVFDIAVERLRAGERLGPDDLPDPP